MMAPAYQLERGFTLTRVLDAPPEVVFQAWTDPAHLDWFFNPDTAPDAGTQVDLRVGGAWRQRMVIDEKTQYMTGGVYREIVANRKLVFTWGASGGWPNLDEGVGPLVTVELIPAGSRTRMDFTVQLPDQLSDAEAKEWMSKGIDKGWAETVARLVQRYQVAAQG
jgi:uncharacterized protein YndB with AHSA1/START domain